MYQKKIVSFFKEKLKETDNKKDLSSKVHHGFILIQKTIRLNLKF
jgi:hypothetical protein